MDSNNPREPFEKWQEEIIKSATPIVNAWRAKIPQLKEDLIKLKNAKDDDERKRLAAEQQAKAEEEAKRRNSEIQEQHLSTGMAIDSRAELDKLSNSFVEQAANQQMGSTGPTELVLKFVDPKLTPKALTTIIIQCLASPKFPGVQKRDKKTEKLVFDPHGNPEYIPAVQCRIDFFFKQ